MKREIKGTLEIDESRGVIYFHADDVNLVSLLGTITLLRISALPTPIPSDKPLDVTGGRCNWRRHSTLVKGARAGVDDKLEWLAAHPELWSMWPLDIAKIDRAQRLLLPNYREIVDGMKAADLLGPTTNWYDVSLVLLVEKIRARNIVNAINSQQTRERKRAEKNA